MMTLSYWLVVVWFVGAGFFAVRALNFTRLTLNNLTPGTNYWESANKRSLTWLRAGPSGSTLRQSILNCWTRPARNIERKRSETGDICLPGPWSAL